MDNESAACKKVADFFIGQPFFPKGTDISVNLFRNRRYNDKIRMNQPKHLWLIVSGTVPSALKPQIFANIAHTMNKTSGIL